MQAISDTLGLNLRDVIWHLVNYAALLLCLWWVGFRPVMRKLTEREQRVRDRLAHAERAQAEAAQAEAVRDSILLAARSEAETIVSQARAEAELILAGAHAHAGGDASQSARS
jgi:F-type H+-transporting ATPase subunit b